MAPVSTGGFSSLKFSANRLVLSDGCFGQLVVSNCGISSAQISCLPPVVLNLEASSGSGGAGFDWWFLWREVSVQSLNSLRWMLRLDHFNVSPEWEVKHLNLLQKRLTRSCSDHFPILLDSSCIQREKRPFKFENMWLKVDGFVDLVRSWWLFYHFIGPHSFILGKKLKALKVDIKIWNEPIFCNMESLNKARVAELNAFHKLEGVRDLDTEEKARKSQVVSELELSLLQDEITNNSVSSNQPIIKNHVVQYYESLFSKKCNWRLRLDNLAFDSLDVDEASLLGLPFGERKVFMVKCMHRDKAPGPDRFFMAFFQDYWDMLKADIMGVFSDFHARGKFEKSLNATFIALILKEPGASGLTNFRPISLVSEVYKIIAKVLANMMRTFMAKIISKPQNSFVKGRQIPNSVLIANEFLDGHNKSTNPGVLCKLDMEKAYDYIKWKFLLYLLKRCGFREKWCTWIAHCISLVCFFVLINGSPSGFFGCSHGVR
ncbi:uncharacterized protein LOC132169034 [Corylus avellana]|uniref:uncharacterized protein LOC132169034 n=1 Tax=Corylus avellana TaxID=13451 RepID=UPI00286AAEB3|nr:uncharacterized protein LOC132169034 [Corylus avellana]